jgi:hypothetical protein
MPQNRQTRVTSKGPCPFSQNVWLSRSLDRSPAVTDCSKLFVTTADAMAVYPFPTSWPFRHTAQADSTSNKMANK